MNSTDRLESIRAQGGGYPPGGYGPPGGGGHGPPGSPPPGAPPPGGYGPPGAPPPGGYGPPGAPPPGGYGPPGAPPPGGYGPPGAPPPGGYGPPGAPPPGGYGPPGAPPPGGYGPPGAPPPGGYGPPGAPPPGGYGPPGVPPPGGYGPPGVPPPGGYGPPGAPPPGGYGPPGAPPPGGYGPPGAPPPGGYGPPGAPPPGGYGPPGSPPGGYVPPGAPPGAPPGGYGPPGSPPGYGPPGGGYPPPGGGPPFGGGFAPPPYQPGGPPPGGSSGFEASEAIAFGWAAVTKDFAGIAVPLAVAGFVSTLPSVVLSGIRGGLVGALAASGSADPTVIALINGGGSLVSYLVSIVVQAFIMGGVVQFALRVARGEKPDFNVVFSGGRFFAPMLGGTLLYTLGVTVGFAACIVPGVFLYAGWIAYSAFVVDRGLGGTEALKASWQATAPYRTNIMVYALLSILVGIAGALACCVGALLVSFPVLMIGNAYLYLKLIGEQPRLPGA